MHWALLMMGRCTDKIHKFYSFCSSDWQSIEHCWWWADAQTKSRNLTHFAYCWWWADTQKNPEILPLSSVCQSLIIAKCWADGQNKSINYTLFFCLSEHPSCWWWAGAQCTDKVQKLLPISSVCQSIEHHWWWADVQTKSINFTYFILLSKYWVLLMMFGCTDKICKIYLFFCPVADDGQIHKQNSYILQILSVYQSIQCCWWWADPHILPISSICHSIVSVAADGQIDIGNMFTCNHYYKSDPIVNIFYLRWYILYSPNPIPQRIERWFTHYLLSIIKIFSGIPLSWHQGLSMMTDDRVAMGNQGWTKPITLGPKSPTWDWNQSWGSWMLPHSSLQNRLIKKNQGQPLHLYHSSSLPCKLSPSSALLAQDTDGQNKSINFTDFISPSKNIVALLIMDRCTDKIHNFYQFCLPVKSWNFTDFVDLMDKSLSIADDGDAHTKSRNFTFFICLSKHWALLMLGR